MDEQQIQKKKRKKTVHFLPRNSFHREPRTDNAKEYKRLKPVCAKSM
jgi:hypothetical protein